MSEYSIKDLHFPIFRVGTEKPLIEGNKMYYEQYDKDGIITELVLDDKSVQSNSLAMRRLILKDRDIELKPLRMAIFFLGDFIKLATPKVWFIDSSGFLFKHTKKLRVKLKFYPIAQIIPINTGGSIIEVDSINIRFKTLFAPTNEKYAGLLHLGRAYILYGLYEEKPKDTWRLI